MAFCRLRMEDTYKMIKNEITAGDILHALVSHIVIILSAALVCGLIAFGITKGFIKPKYKAQVTLYAVSNINQDASQISVSEQNSAVQLAKTYAVILKSNTVMQAVSEELKEKGLSYGSGTLKGMVSTYTSETQVFTVSVLARSGKDAQIIADTIADVASTSIVKIVGSGEVRIVDYAQRPASPSSPNISTNTTIGVVVGLLLSCAIVIIRTLTDSTIWTEEDIAKQIEVPILGTVPQLSVTEKETAAKEEKKA